MIVKMSHSTKRGNIMKSKSFYLLNIIFPILVGSILYYVFFPNVVFVQIIDKLFNINLHIAINLKQNIVFSFIRNHFLDMVWAYSFSFVAYLIIKNKSAIIISAIFCCLMELIQLFPNVNGTFDILDMLYETIAITIAFIIIEKRNKP